MDIKDMNEGYLWCRSERHRWDWLRDEAVTAEGELSSKSTLFNRVSQCDRCEAIRTKMISTRTWSVVGHPKIKYPKGYLNTGKGRLAVSAVYKEQFTRSGRRR